MIPLLNDLSIFEDDNLVSIKDCFETMSNDKASPTSYNGFHSLLNLAFCYRIDIRRRFIQNQDLRVSQQSSSNGNQLFLPS